MSGRIRQVLLDLLEGNLLCPYARHFILYLELAQPKKRPYMTDIDDCDLKHQHKQTKIELTPVKPNVTFKHCNNTKDNYNELYATDAQIKPECLK